jgi:lipopolysaccharide/colanic/teichoic acid biosynthesis glycosyltransferase
MGNKRIFDLMISLPGLILLSPGLGFIALTVRLTLGPLILFRQQRPGLDGQPFTVYKFRTMTDARDAQGHLLPDVERLPAAKRGAVRAGLCRGALERAQQAERLGPWLGSSPSRPGSVDAFMPWWYNGQPEGDV